MGHDSETSSEELKRAWRFRLAQLKISMPEMIGWLALWFYLPSLIVIIGSFFDFEPLDVIDQWLPEWLPTSFTLLMMLVSCFMLIYALKIKKLSLSFFGIQKPLWKKDLPFLFLMIVCGAGIFSLLLLGLLGAIWLAPELVGAQKGDSPFTFLQQHFGAHNFSFQQLSYMILIAPVMEELWFRGWMYPVMRKHFPKNLAISLVAILFALAHSWPPITQIIGGFLFTFSYEKRPNLFIPIVLHMLGNASLVAISWLFLL